ncbi:hypothetical protein Aoki45_32120 [Algoriphagus sp. oki45]|uniref:hypothetical protein n=1 Tax=Algoriphagus sp. oki45 TaxID=3067294 RepID=UPI0027FDFC8D|nr:hypothetical protein Aoki45_32120 [Algoriphagus sp. oki45]
MKFNPFQLYFLWVVICVGFWLLIPVIGGNYDSSAQVPFALKTYTMVSFICGLFIISVFLPFRFKDWFKKYWLFNCFICLITGIVIVFFAIKVISL